MLKTRNKLILAVVAIVGVVGMGRFIGAGNPRVLAHDPPAEFKPRPAAEVCGAQQVIGPSDSAEMKLMKKRMNLGQVELELRYGEYSTGRGTLDILLQANRKVRDSELDLATSATDRLNALKRCHEFAKAVHDLNYQRFLVGALKSQDLMSTEYEVVDAELRLMRAEKEANPKR